MHQTVILNLHLKKHGKYGTFCRNVLHLTGWSNKHAIICCHPALFPVMSYVTVVQVNCFYQGHISLIGLLRTFSLSIK